MPWLFVNGGKQKIPDNFCSREPGALREEDDDLIRQAVALIILERKASVSYLQRRLKIGYNRAAEILAALEKRELVSPLRAGGKREILANFSQE